MRDYCRTLQKEISYWYRIPAIIHGHTCTKLRVWNISIFLESDEVFLARYRKAHSIKQAGILDKIQDTVSPALRWTIFGVNVFFWCVGIFFMFLGVWAFIQKTQKLSEFYKAHCIFFWTFLCVLDQTKMDAGRSKLG